MRPDSPVPDETRDALRRLATPHALRFGSRLLQRSTGGVITFREFVSVAREFLDDEPADVAVYLAALVALDMGVAGDAPRHHGGCPSLN